MLIVAALALLVVAFVVLFITARRSRAFVPVTALLAGSAILSALHLRNADRKEMRLSAEVARSESRITSYCGSLAFGLWADVDEYRTMRAEGSGYTESDILVAQTKYMRSSVERNQFARMCVPDSGDETKPLDCLPRALNDATAERIERAATAIKARKRCE